MAALRDLEGLIKACRHRYKGLPEHLEPSISAGFWEKFKPAYESRNTDKIIFCGTHSFVVLNANGSERSDLSTRWMMYAYAFSPFYQALSEYERYLKKILTNVGILGLAGQQKNDILIKMPNSGWKSAVDLVRLGTSAAIDTQTNTLFAHDPVSKARFEKFLSDPGWWCQGKNFSREVSDWLGSSVKKAACVIQANSDRLPAVIGTVALDAKLRVDLKALLRKQIRLVNTVLSLAPRKTGARNVIYYGAPGTGKSHRIRKDTEHASKETVITTVFHADTQNSDFVGSFKPSISNGELDYRFQPGPFTNALVWAMNNPTEMYFLVVEEINRAPAAAVFGEIFQLLDRKPGGNSDYEINPSDAAHEAYLAEKIPGWTGMISLPSNLTLLASMNSSDQAVMPLDTAFKRRWEFVYIPISFDPCTQGDLPIPDFQGKLQPVEWKVLAFAINLLLADLGVSEDRFLGPFFITDEEIAPAPSAVDEAARTVRARAALCGKLFMYLWDDVLRHSDRNIIFAPHVRTYGQLVDTYTRGKQIFSKAMLDQLFSGPAADDSIES